MPEAKSGAVSKPFDRQEVSPSRFSQLLPARLSTSAAYGPFVMHVVDATPLEASATFSDPVITRGRHRVRRKIGSRLVEGWSDPGTINIIPAHCDGVDHGPVARCRAELVGRPILADQVRAFEVPTWLPRSGSSLPRGTTCGGSVGS